MPVFESLDPDVPDVSSEPIISSSSFFFLLGVFVICISKSPDLVDLGVSRDSQVPGHATCVCVINLPFCELVWGDICLFQPIQPEGNRGALRTAWKGPGTQEPDSVVIGLGPSVEPGPASRGQGYLVRVPRGIHSREEPWSQGC